MPNYASIAALASDLSDEAPFTGAFVGQYATANRPSAAAHSGKVLWDTDLGGFYESNGTTWDALPSGGGTVDVVSNVATSTVLGRTTAGSGDSEELTPAQVRTLLNVEDGADVTDATNVANAGAVMEADTSTASMSFVIDEDDMASNSATKVPTQQSVKAYADSLVPATPASVGCRLTRTAAYTLTTSGTTYTIPWDGEAFDSDLFHDNTTNNTRITIPTGLGGLYIVGTTLGMAAFTGANQRFLGWISLNGSTTIDYVEIGGDGNSQIPFISLSTAVSLSAGDYLEAKVIQTTGGSRSFTVSPSNFWAVRIGPNP